MRVGGFERQDPGDVVPRGDEVVLETSAELGHPDGIRARSQQGQL